ncbi:MAG: hypothetical protein RLZZ584_3629 [Pseudomonadota bacterium]
MPGCVKSARQLVHDCGRSVLAGSWGLVFRLDGRHVCAQIVRISHLSTQERQEAAMDAHAHAHTPALLSARQPALACRACRH